MGGSSKKKKAKKQAAEAERELEQARAEQEEARRIQEEAIAVQRAEVERERVFQEGMANQARAQEALSGDNLSDVGGGNKPYLVQGGNTINVEGESGDGGTLGGRRKKRNQLSSLLGV